jgi:hypothetical protein
MTGSDLELYRDTGDRARPGQLILIRRAAAALFEVEVALDCSEIAGAKAARASVLEFGDGGIVIFLFLLIEREFRQELLLPARR